MQHSSVIRRPPPILASVFSAGLSLLAILVWPVIAARGLVSVLPMVRTIFPQITVNILYDISIWLAYLVIAAILAVVITRSHLDALTKWMFLTFFALIVVCELTRIMRLGSFIHERDLRLLATLTAISTAIVIAYLALAHRIFSSSADEYVTSVHHMDALTGLPTLNILEGRIEKLIQSCNVDGKESGPSSFTVMVVDLDQFKRVNQSLGHSAGDELIFQVSKRLRRTLRRSDLLARTGADEFVVVLSRAQHARKARAIAVQLQRALAGSLLIEEHELAVTASIGICFYPEGGQDTATLLHNAHTAMYAAKRSGFGRSELFTRDMASDAEKKLRIERELRHALARNEFELHYQPQISLSTGHVTGIEALIRWNSQMLGRVAPNDFLPLASEIHIMDGITDWVIQSACNYTAALNAQLHRAGNSPMVIALNLSPDQLLREDIPGIIGNALLISGLPGPLLEIEITENALMDDSPRTLETLRQIRNLGVRVAIDDFGTGFSSMSYILRFNIDRLKIDQSFVRDCAENPQSAVVVCSIINMAHGLGIQVIAEGVEEREHMNMLTEAGCEDAQGYFFSRPVTAEELPAALERLEPRHHAIA